MATATMNSEQHPGLDALGVDLDQQTIALIGVGGIGLEAARICTALGASLLLFDRSRPTGQISLPHQERHTWHECDITCDTDRSRLVAACAQVDALIITSAIYPTESLPDPGAESDWSDWNRHLHHTLEANLAAPMQICLQLLPGMQERKQGRIVLTGSLAGRNGGLLSGPQYSTSKGALHTFVRWLALRAAPYGINVNGVAPGVTETPMIEGRTIDASRVPAGRAASPMEVARVISFLASPAASYIHGQIVDVNGGAFIG